MVDETEALKAKDAELARLREEIEALRRSGGGGATGKEVGDEVRPGAAAATTVTAGGQGINAVRSLVSR